MPATLNAPPPPFSAVTADLKTITSLPPTCVISFFPAAFSGTPTSGCEMQLCAISHLASEHPSTKFYAVSGDLPFANDAFKRRLDLSFDVLSDPRLDTCDKWVGRCRLGNFLKEAGVSDALEGVETCARGCVVVKEGVVVYVTSGGDDPGKMPDLGEVKKALGV